MVNLLLGFFIGAVFGYGIGRYVHWTRRNELSIPNSSTQHSSEKSQFEFLGTVRVWKDGDQWRWAPAGEWAPDNAQTAERHRDGDFEVIYIDHGDSGEFIRGAVKGSY